MSMTESMIVVKIEGCVSSDREIEQSTSLLSAIVNGCGFLVSRHNFTGFTRTLGRDIAFLIRETDLP